MNNKSNGKSQFILQRLVVMCSAIAATAGLGQTTYVWTNQYVAQLSVNGGDMNQATNWSPNGVPNPMTGPDANGAYGDLMQFAGVTTGPISVTESGGLLSGSGGQRSPYGVRIELTSNQTDPVTIFSAITASGGLRMNWITADAGAGGLILGDHSANSLDILAGELNGQNFGFTNNSFTPSVINESVRWRLGGAGAHPFIFAGTGDWIINNHMRSADSSVILIQKFGPGTMTWTGTNNLNSSFSDYLGTPVTIGGGTMIVKSSDLLNANAGAPNMVHNGALLKFDWTPAPGITTTPDAVPGNISGTGPIQINNGTVTFSGANTFTGNLNLAGGELIAGHAENVGVSGPLGQGGTISFNGGTLGFSTNIAFDYSPRFGTADGQAYSIDTAGQNVTFATGLGSPGGSLTKLGTGSLTLNGNNTYGGNTVINAGTLFLNGSNTAAYTLVTGVFPGMLGGTGTLSGPVTLFSETTLAPGASSGSIGTLTINNNLTNGGNLAIKVNKSRSPPNDFVVVSGVLINNGAGTLTVTNLGPALAVGDKFTLFSKPLQNGSALTVAGAGANWSNNLAVDGSISVLSFSPTPILNLNLTGGHDLQFSWTGSFKLQAQTNNLNSGLGNNWADYPGGSASPVTVPMVATNGAIFFRLVSTP